MALCPWGPRASGSSAKPSLMMVQQDWSGPLQPAHLSLITITGLESRVQLDVAGRSENFLVYMGLPTLSWPPTIEPSPPKPVPFWVLQEKQLQKESPEHFFVSGMDKYFPTTFWWSLSVLLPSWEDIFPCLWNLAAIAVFIEDTLKLSFGGKLFLPATKWNSWTGEAIYGYLIKGSSVIK